MTQWQQAWRTVVAPNLTEAGLRALAAELRDGGGRLISHAFMEYEHGKPVCGCAVGFAVWHSNPSQSDTDAHAAIMRVMADCAVASGAASPCLTTFTSFFDAGWMADRETLFAMLLPEVERAIVTHMADGVVTLTDEWWDTPNRAFGGMSPWDDLVTFGMEKAEMMLLQMIHCVAN